jgi:hypothetical protein
LVGVARHRGGASEVDLGDLVAEPMTLLVRDAVEVDRDRK